MSELAEFINASKAKGASDDFLAALLTRRGWPEDAVYSALGTYWATETGVPIPESPFLKSPFLKKKSSAESAREAFLYLLAFATLALWASALGSAMFIYIEHWFPDPVSQQPYYGTMRGYVTWQMATMVVAFPVFLLVMRAIVKENAANPERPQSGVRKWLTYIALLLTAGSIIGDLIWFLASLLQGEITVRFVLKSAVVMVICAAIFLYYLGSLRVNTTRWNLPYAIGSFAAVLAVFLIGFGVAGTPSQNRLRQADARRADALRYLWLAIRSQEAPPVSLSQFVQDGHVTGEQIADPETHRPFEYYFLSGTKYQLCATFSTASDPDSNFEVRGNEFWRHGVGRKCFTLDASKSSPTP
jgi:hypothetical protein